MKVRVQRFVVGASFVLLSMYGSSLSAAEPAGPYSGFPILRGSWLGQVLPGDEAEVFASGILKPPGGYHSSVVFSPSGNEAAWTSMGAITYMSRVVDGIWQRPKVLPWDSEFGVGEPFYAPSGNRVYFLSRRPPPGERGERERIWFVERLGAGWSTPQPIGTPVSDHPTHWQFSLSDAGNLYFTSEVPEVRGKQDIYVAVWSSEGFQTPRDIGPSVNSEVRDFCPFIAPDESYIIFARSVPEQRGRSDLFVSFRDQAGNWTPALNLGPAVNSRHNEVSPVVTPGGDQLIFTRISSEVNDAHWVSFRVIERLRPR